eukprot:451004-Rhodomonas_salina.2
MQRTTRAPLPDKTATACSIWSASPTSKSAALATVTPTSLAADVKSWARPLPPPTHLDHERRVDSTAACHKQHVVATGNTFPTRR